MVRSLNTKREVHLGKEEEEGESVYTMAAVGWQGRRSDSGQRSGNIIKADKIEIGNFPIATALFLPFFCFYSSCRSLSVHCSVHQQFFFLFLASTTSDYYYCSIQSTLSTILTPPPPPDCDLTIKGSGVTGKTDRPAEGALKNRLRN